MGRDADADGWRRLPHRMDPRPWKRKGVQHHAGTQKMADPARHNAGEQTPAEVTVPRCLLTDGTNFRARRDATRQVSSHTPWLMATISTRTSTPVLWLAPSASRG